MATPSQRLQALVSAHELLRVLQQDVLMPPEHSHRARIVSRDFPKPSDLLSLIQSCDKKLPLRFVQALDDARTLFEELEFGRSGSPACRSELAQVLRHYPERGAAARVAEHCIVGGLKAWLVQEKHAMPGATHPPTVVSDGSPAGTDPGHAD